FVQQRFCRHDHAGGAVAALKGKFIDERLLQRMERAVGLLQAFDGRDVFAARLVRQVRAGADRRAVDQYGASTANLDFAGNFGAIEIWRITQNLSESFLRFTLDLPGFAVKLK